MRCVFILVLSLSATALAQSIFDDEWEPPRRRSETPAKVDPPAQEEAREEEPAQPEPEPMKEEPAIDEEPEPVQVTDEGRIRLDTNRFEKANTREKTPDLPVEPPAELSNLSPVEQKLKIGLSQLKAPRADEAAATFTNLLSELPKPASGKLDDPNRINAMHGLAVAYMHLGELPKAREQMDRIYACPKTNRSIVLNHAILDLQSRGFAVRAATNLSRYLESEPKDERAINLFGLAIKRGIKESRAATMKKHMDAYLRFDAQLEKTKPGMKRWGSNWIDTAEHAEIMKRRERQLRICEDINRNLQEAEDDLDRAKKEYTRRRLSRSGNLDYYQRRIENADRTADSLANDLTRERREIETPKWQEDFTPIVPELELKNK